MITSKENPQIKELKKLQQKRFRLRSGRFAAEGEDLVSAALAAGWTPQAIYCSPDAPAGLAEEPAATPVSYDVLASASALGSGARVIAVFDLPKQQDAASNSLGLFAERVADPGNVGTLIRCAAAFSDDPVMLGDGCADPYSPKGLRAAMGATFAAPPLLNHEPEFEAATVVALDGAGDTDLREVTASGPTVICVGGEREGLSEQILQRADVRARIAMRDGGPESLNVAMAAAIGLYELGKKLQPSVHGSLGAGKPAATEK